MPNHFSHSSNQLSSSCLACDSSNQLSNHSTCYSSFKSFRPCCHQTIFQSFNPHLIQLSNQSAVQQNSPLNLSAIHPANQLSHRLFCHSSEQLSNRSICQFCHLFNQLSNHSICHSSYQSVLFLSFFDSAQAWLACSFSVLSTAVVTNLVKNIVGRPRPDFMNRCFPEGIPETPFADDGHTLLCTGNASEIKEGCF